MEEVVRDGVLVLEAARQEEGTHLCLCARLLVLEGLGEYQHTQECGSSVAYTTIHLHRTLAPTSGGLAP